ncbi:MAG: hypothetical protein HFE75_08055 [Firmicutes bacterium]|jgi:glutamate racemase|nr:hypothetical protein [Bacillota bacterium]
MKKSLLKKGLAFLVIACMSASTLMLTGCGGNSESTSGVAADVAAIEKAADETRTKSLLKI